MRASPEEYENQFSRHPQPTTNVSCVNGDLGIFLRKEREKSHEYTAPTQLATRLLQHHSTQLVLSYIIVSPAAILTIMPALVLEL